jgi:exoribonuclease-2
MYGIYNDFQRQMERYWCLRWLQQEKAAASADSEVVITGSVIRENLVRIANIPLVFKAHSMPEQPPHTKVTLGVGDIDLLDLNLHTRFISAEAPAPAVESAA